MPDYKWMKFSELEKHIPEAEQLGVSKVARSDVGFVEMYRSKRHPNSVTDAWKKKRVNFIKRHLAQYKIKPTHRRKLALIMWAYTP